MAQVNIDSIMAKIDAKLQSGDAKKRIDEITDEKCEKIANEAGDKFIGVLRNAIRSSGISSDAADKISELEYSVRKIGDGKYEAFVWFSGDQSRMSLKGGDEMINKLPYLLNNGVDHTMHVVHGEWHDKEYYSRTKIPGAHFIEQAIIDFKANYGSDYGVEEVTFDPNNY